MLPYSGARPNLCGCKRIQFSLMFLGLLMTFLIQSTFGQHSEIILKSLSVEEGLSHATAHHIMQDHNGFIWVSTRDGLNRYDGRSFKKFRRDPEDTNSLSSNTVWITHEDREGLIWIGTSGGGLNIYDPDRRRFYHFVHDEKDPESIGSNTVLSIFEDREGTIWIGTEGGGLNKVVERRHGAEGIRLRFKRYLARKNNPESLSHNTVMDIEQDDKGHLWLATYGGGINKFDKEREIFFPEYKIGGKFVMSVALKGHQLWAGTKYHGLSMLDLHTGSLKVFQQDTKDPGSLSSNFVWPVLIDREGTVWAGTFGGGVNRITKNRKTGGSEFSIATYQNSSRDNNPIPDNYITSIYQDKSGLVWIATNNSGIFILREKELFKKPEWVIQNSELALADIKFNDFLKDRSGNYWMGTTSGLLYKEKGGKKVRFIGDGKSKIVNAIEQLDSGDLLIGTNVGLYILRENTSRPRILNAFTPDGGGPLDRVYDIVQDSKENIWLSTNTGIWKLDAKLKVREQYHESSTPHSLSNSNTGSLYLEGDTLWISTSEAGLNKLNIATGTVRQYRHIAESPASISSNKVMSMLRDNRGNFWIGTSGGGLNKLAYRQGKTVFEKYFKQDGLPDNSIKHLSLDKSGNMWIVTQNGLARFDLQNDTIIPITIPVTYSNRNLDEIFSMEDNEYLLTASKGVQLFDPREFEKTGSGASLIMTGIKIKGEEYQATKSSFDLSTLVLAYHENYLRFEFSLLDYLSSEFASYHYKLEGVDREWISAGRANFASYSALPPDNYTFRVRATGFDGVPAQNELAVKVSILPPFWHKWWFRLAVLVLVASILRAAYNYRINSLLKIERTRRRIASDLHDEVSASLSSITYFAEAIQQVESREKAQRFVKLISDSASEAKEKMTDIIWSIDPEHDDWINLLSKCRRFASDLLESKNIRYNLDIDNDISYPLDRELRQHLWLIFKEMVVNIARHSEAQSVDITFGLHKNVLQLVVRDDGIGMDQLSECGSGNGLKNIKKRAGEINADLELETASELGSRWTLRLKLR